MTISEKLLERLRDIYDLHINQKQDYRRTSADLSHLSDYRREVFISELELLAAYGYIKLEKSSNEITCKITDQGLNKIIRLDKEVPDKNASNSIGNITVNGTFNSILGTNVSHNTIQQGYTFDDLRKLIDDTISDKQELEIVRSSIEPILKRIEIGAPIEKGMLSSISSNIEKYQGIYGAIGQMIMTFLCNK